MGWIANLKKTPAFGGVEDISVTGGETKTVVNREAPTIRVTQGTGTNYIKFGPLPAESIGSMKTAICVSLGTGTVDVGPYPAGADASGLRNARLEAVGEVAQWVWDGSKWNSVDGYAGNLSTASDFS